MLQRIPNSKEADVGEGALFEGQKLPGLDELFQRLERTPRLPTVSPLLHRIPHDSSLFKKEEHGTHIVELTLVHAPFLAENQHTDGRRRNRPQVKQIVVSLTAGGGAWLALRRHPKLVLTRIGIQDCENQENNSTN